MNNIHHNKLSEAYLLQQQGNFEEAKKIYKSIVADDPSNNDAWHLLGITHAQLREYTQALECLNHAIEITPNEPSYYNNKGNILLRQKKYDQAVTCYKKTLELNPQYALAHNNLGNCYYRQGQLTAAREAYENALRLSPEYIEAHYNLGILLAKLGEFNKAITSLKKMLTLDKNYAPAYGQLAEIYLQKNNHKKAIQYFEKRLSLQPLEADTWHSLGQAQLQQEKYQDAIESLKKALDINETHSEANHDLAIAYLKSGNPDEALTHFLRQIPIHPKIDSYFNAGVILMKKSRFKEAIMYFKHVASLDPDYLPVFLNLGAIYLQQNNTTMAIEAYQQAQKLKPDDQEITHILSALTQETTPSTAPKIYLERLFDQYATYYDVHLTQYLTYRVPEKLYEALCLDAQLQSRTDWQILDLGCGTGLCGAYFKPVANKLIGIDISPNMIEQAKEKALYDALSVADIQVAILDYHQIDIILAADVLTYIGALENLLNHISDALTDDGWFAFSVEKTNVEPYVLQKTIRYAHSRPYIEQVIAQTNALTIQRFDNIILREQAKKPIEGYLVLVQKSSHKPKV